MTTNPLSALGTALETDVINLALPTLQNIQTAFNAIAAAPGNAVVLAEQEAVIVANVNQLLVQAPALLPILQSSAISAGATTASGILADIISKLQSVIAPTPVSVPPVGA
jgi:hypothetical protein